MKLPINEIICGAMPEATKGFPDGSVNCSISSPPYWALRDYGVDGQLGLEPTFEEYIDKLCTIYDEVKRVLRDDGTCWVNLGDTYNSDSKGSGGTHYPDGTPYKQMTNPGSRYKIIKSKTNLPKKSLCLIPQRFAIEMVNRGWILRNVIIWHKPNPMPSSAKDRFTVDFEYVYFFVKSNNILYWVRPDGKMVSKQPDYKSGAEGLDWQWGLKKGKKVKLSLWKGSCYWFEPQYEPLQCPERLESRPFDTDNMDRKQQYDGKSLRGQGINPNTAVKSFERIRALGRNKRTVWTIPTQPFPEAHFATFPEKLVEPMIKAGCPEFVCTKCGKAREKIYDKSGGTTGQSWHPHKNDIGEGNVKQQTGSEFKDYKVEFVGYTDCGCNADWRPGIVWDCFCWLWHDFTGSCKAAA
jgi:site-specific DNA-methyltransferase (adenine-specific)